MNILNYQRLQQLSSQYSAQYANAEPFPSTIIDDFFDIDIFNYIHDSFPPPSDDVWKTPTNVHTKAKSVIKRGSTGIKENMLSQDCKSILYQLNSATFLSFLEDLTGIDGLCPDPYFNEAGFHLSKGGGILDIHADYSHHDRLRLERRVNLIVYLNKEWELKYQGFLGLYTRDLQIAKTVAPIANRALIFTTSEMSFHGFPDPIILPDDYVSRHYGRKSIAMYYYSLPTGRPKHKIIFPQDPCFEFVPSQE